MLIFLSPKIPKIYHYMNQIEQLKSQLKIPVIGAPLFLVSGPELVIAQCKSGIVGSFPALNARPQHVLDEWITRIKDELAKAKEADPEKRIAPFAVNQICHGSNDRLFGCLLYTSPSPRDYAASRMPSSA